MKTLMLAFVLLYTLSISIQPLLVAADSSPKEVVDTSGKILRAGTNYYILPAVPITRCRVPNGRCRIQQAGFSLASVGEYCPLDVVVVERYQAQPVTFTPINPKKGVIRISTDLNIQFCGYSKCPQSTVWKLDRFDYSSKQWFVTTGGIVGKPGWETINNWFKIEECDGDYKLVYCPSVCKSCKHLCRNVGMFVDQNGNRRVALTDAPYKVKFQKA
ncbi:miraculin-like [Prosopis cineraria]|uniref:miraculin-like n=1 Tax=Prosopis cineraria TaxID=364024 RepID=UPI002410B0F6|nr:miraculin-like [Prosopis cineraria]